VKLTERRDPVAQVMEHERRHHKVHARIYQKCQRLSQIVEMQFRAIADPRVGDLKHGGAHIAGHHCRSVVNEPLSYRPRTAADLQNPLAGDIAEQRYRRWAFVIAVGGTAGIVAVVLDCHRVIFRRSTRRVLVRHSRQGTQGNPTTGAV
jgi:hypothetical protein